MDRDTAIKMAQHAIKAKNKRLVDAVLQIRAEREKLPAADVPVAELPLIAVTCATGWECYAVVEELTKTLKYRVRALYRTPGTPGRATFAVGPEIVNAIPVQSHVAISSADGFIKAPGY